MTKRALAPIEGGGVRLRLLTEADLPVTLAWRNQYGIRRWFVHDQIIEPAQHAAWFARYLPRDDDFVFIIEDVADHRRPVGQAALYNVNWDARRAEFGRLMIGEASARGKGLARAATQALVDFGLRDLGLHEIYLEVFADNAAALAIYERCGFRPAPDQVMKDASAHGLLQLRINRADAER